VCVHVHPRRTSTSPTNFPARPHDFLRRWSLSSFSSVPPLTVVQKPSVPARPTRKTTEICYTRQPLSGQIRALCGSYGQNARVTVPKHRIVFLQNFTDKSFKIWRGIKHVFYNWNSNDAAPYKITMGGEAGFMSNAVAKTAKAKSQIRFYPPENWHLNILFRVVHCFQFIRHVLTVLILTRLFCQSIISLFWHSCLNNFLFDWNNCLIGTEKPVNHWTKLLLFSEIRNNNIFLNILFGYFLFFRFVFSRGCHRTKRTYACF